MEKSPARVTRDLSAPWLRHSGRDDGLGGVYRARRSFDCRFAIAPRSFDCRFAIASSVISIVGSL